jgi:hypothetical protein
MALSQSGCARSNKSLSPHDRTLMLIAHTDCGARVIASPETDELECDLDELRDSWDVRIRA